MIMADKIVELRKRNGWSQEELAGQLGVSRQSISKWESAQSVPDLSKVVAMASVFGVTTDYLLRDELECADLPDVTVEDHTSEATDIRWVSMGEAHAYLEAETTASGRIALGVLLCILSPIPVMLGAGFGMYAGTPFTEDQGATFGTILTIALIAAGVFFFVKQGIALSKFEYLEKEPIETEYGVSGMVREKMQAFEHTRTLFLVSGIVLCVLSVIPVLICAMLAPDNDTVMIIGSSALLALVAVGVFLIVSVSVIWSAFQKLLEEGDYTRRTKKANNSPVMGIYWMLITAIYLGYSFYTMRWDRSWIIWPVAGVLSAIVAIVVKQRTGKD